MRVFSQVFCQKLKLSVGFEGAYLGEIRNHRNVCGQHLTKVLLVFFVECAKQGGRAACGFFFSKNLSNLQAFPCPWPFHRIRLCAAWGKAQGLQNEPGS